MKTVKIATLKDQLSKHLRAVEAGAEFLVTDRNRPIARITGVGPVDGPLPLEPPRTSLRDLQSRQWPRAGWRLRSDVVLAEERSDR